MIRRFPDLLAGDPQHRAVGQIAEVSLRHRHQLGVTASGVVERELLHPAQQIGVMVVKMIAQNLSQVALAVTVAEEQNPVGVGDGLRELVEVGVIEGCPLSSDVAIMAMAESLTTAPQLPGP